MVLVLEVLTVQEVAKTAVIVVRVAGAARRARVITAAMESLEATVSLLV
jgi:hypothetical protein